MIQVDWSLINTIEVSQSKKIKIKTIEKISKR